MSIQMRRSAVQSSPPGNLEDDLAHIVSLAGPAATPEELSAELKQIYRAVLDVDLGRYDPAEVKISAPTLMKAIFAARVTLRDRIADWHARGLMTREVQKALRDVFRISRYGADMLGEILIDHQRLAHDAKTRRAFTGTDHNTQVHPRFERGGDITFKSGDVLLMRGMAHNSAAIARIGDVDTQFSHLAMIYIDPAGKHWVVEALIEDGAVVNTLDHVLDHGLARAVLYRCKDAALAARAAELIHARVKASSTRKGRHIPYDFSMRLRNRRKLFCSKLVYLAFKDASGGKLMLPAFKTRFDQRNPDFFRRIGVKARETFAPGDIDLDPAFDLVAEWQDYRATSRIRMQDMIMTKFFEWMEVRGYKFKEDFFIRLVAVFGRLSSYLSKTAKGLISSVVPKVPANMSRRTIATIAMLHKTAEDLVPALRALEDNCIKMTGRPLHARALLDHLERLRETSRGRIGYLVGRA
jgi:hypothetical protein